MASCSVQTQSAAAFAKAMGRGEPRSLNPQSAAVGTPQTVKAEPVFFHQATNK